MSKDIIVLTPNGRRIKVNCTPDTSILQVLEDVCLKQGISPTDYDLKHHNTILDLSTTIRFSNLPNKATLEIVEAERTRQETNVTIGLLLEDGDRKTGDFPPNASLYEIINFLAPNALACLEQPSIMYMRQEVTGAQALKDKTLRMLGLFGGRAILRLLNKSNEPMQANVSAIYRRPITEKKENKVEIKKDSDEDDTNLYSTAGPSRDQTINKTEMEIAEEVIPHANEHTNENIKMDCDNEHNSHPDDKPVVVSARSSTSTQEHLERRLKIEEEVNFIGAQKAIAFMQPDGLEDELDDLPDDFYDLTIEEVRRIYHDLQQQRINLENSPLISAKIKGENEKQSSVERIQKYNNVVVRIQFPDHMILQGVFNPSNTINEVTEFIKEHLKNPEKQFQIYTTPMKEYMNPEMSLLEAKFVPCVLMHFKWSQEDSSSGPFLKDEIYANTTPSDAASILASKYRAPNRRNREDSCSKNGNTSSAPSKSNKVPKWFKK